MAAKTAQYVNERLIN